MAFFKKQKPVQKTISYADYLVINRLREKGDAMTAEDAYEIARCYSRNELDTEDENRSISWYLKAYCGGFSESLKDIERYAEKGNSVAKKTIADIQQGTYLPQKEIAVTEPSCVSSPIKEPQNTETVSDRKKVMDEINYFLEVSVPKKQEDDFASMDLESFFSQSNNPADMKKTEEMSCSDYRYISSESQSLYDDITLDIASGIYNPYDAVTSDDPFDFYIDVSDM